MTRVLSSLESFQFKVKQIDHAADNKAVVDIYSGLKERSAADWHLIQTFGMKFNKRKSNLQIKVLCTKWDGFAPTLREDLHG